MSLLIIAALRLIASLNWLNAAQVPICLSSIGELT